MIDNRGFCRVWDGFGDLFHPVFFARRGAQRGLLQGPPTTRHRPASQRLPSEAMTADSRISQYFSRDYAEAREAFLAAARDIGADVDSFRNPHPVKTAVTLCTDVALLGPADADNILVLISGTHGVEGFAGSAIQVGLLRSGMTGWPKPNVRIVMIHAFNPFGFDQLRRSNEDNVDLNRNFIDHSLPHPENREYARLSKAIAPSVMSGPANALALMRILGYWLAHGRARLQQAVTHGQYSHPRGLFFGGRHAVWSNRILHEIVARHLAGSRRVVSIDVHTGLGPYGYGEVILNDTEDSPAFRRALAWWGSERVRSTVSGKSVSAHLSGTINLAFARMLPEQEVTAVGLEFGTLPGLEVLRVMRAENWLHHHAGQDHAGAARIKEQLLRAFYPDDELWKRKVWEQGRVVIEQALSVIDGP
jgi:hypothetical protein